MKIRMMVLLGCLCCSVSFAEYEELDALEQSSRQFLSRYAQQMAAENARFKGVIALGQALQTATDGTAIEVAKLTYHSKDYWRAVLEATPKDSSILFAHAHLRATYGETAWVDAYFLLGNLTAGKSNRAELEKYQRLRNRLNKRTGKEIGEGIRHHDKREYNRAIEIYNRVIAEHPNCALAYYEKGLSYLMMSRADPSFRQKALQMYAECRLRDPFHWKAYQGNDPNVIRKLQVYLKQVHPFLSGKERNKEGLVAFADGCEAMELYPIAAHAQWKLVLIDAANAKQHLKRFIDLIEKAGCKEADFFRRQFKLNGPKPPD